ncbi:MAG: hypothetical protein ABW023_13270, partial [Sphingomonas sp.]
MLLTVLVGLWALLLTARGTPIGDWLHRWMVAKPAATLSKIRRDTVVTLVLLVALGAGVFWVMGHEGVQLYSMALPELTGMLAMLDVTALLDAAIVLVAAGSAAGWNNLRAALAYRL